MLPALVAAAFLTLAADPASPPASSGEDVIACVKAAIPDWDDGISDAATIAKVAVAQCSDQIQALTLAGAKTNGYINNPTAVAGLRHDLTEMFSSIAIKFVLQYRHQDRTSHAG
jgi:hypothetical protein